MKKASKRATSLFLALVMTFSLAIGPTTALAKKADPPKPGDMAAIVELLTANLDGEKSFDYLSKVYLGWRTTGGPWQNHVIKDYVGEEMKKAGYTYSDKDLSGNNTKPTEAQMQNFANDFFYVQHDESASMVWAPEYARLQITKITPPVTPPAVPAEAAVVPDAVVPEVPELEAPAPEADVPLAPKGEADAVVPEVPEADEPEAVIPEVPEVPVVVVPEDAAADAVAKLAEAKRIFDVDAYGFDPTSAVYQAHYNDLYQLGADITATASNNFIQKMWDWIIKTGTIGDGSTERVNVFPEGKAIGAATGNEAELNKRAHLPTNAGFNATAEEIKAVRAAATNPNVGELIAGKTGEAVYIGEVSSKTVDGKTVYSCSKGYTDAELAGKVLLSDSSNSTTFKYAVQVGAISVMTTAALDYFHNPEMGSLGTDDQKWYGMNDPAHAESKTEWYTDSARFAGGVGSSANKAQMDAGKPIVEWNISPDQYNTLMNLLKEKNKVEINVASLGTMYPMSKPATPVAGQRYGEGQLTAIAEIKGAKYPDERVVLAAHVQEPSSNDNATGVGLNLELATRMMKMVEDGTIARPDRTITFLWGDEMAFSKLYLEAHPEEAKKIVCSIDLDMVGEDTKKTGGPMRIEKAPDPSAYYTYMLDRTPEDPPYLDSNFASLGNTEDGAPKGAFVRGPDSHTLWGAGNPAKYDIGGVYLNDLYMAAAQAVITENGDKNQFRVDVCPYEGGSDHGKFLEKGIPAVLTWHFTDYVYHTTVDTLYMSSAQEMKDVGVTSLATAYLMANPTEATLAATIDTLVAAATERLSVVEKENTNNHVTFTKGTHADKAAELAQEKEVLNAWGNWYKESITTLEKYFGAITKTESSKTKMAAALATIDSLQTDATHYADVAFSERGIDFAGVVTVKRVSAATADTNTNTTPTNGLSLAHGGEKFEATLTVNAAGASANWTASEWSTWASNLKWFLTRANVDPTGQDPDLYPNIYTGDDLAKWRTWGDKANLFKSFKAVAAPKTGDGKVAIKLTFETDPGGFYGSTTGAPGRNVFGSFTGTYQFNARDGASDVAVKSAPLAVNIYDSYRIYANISEELKAIKAAAEAKGRYFEIHNYGQSEGGFELYYVTLADKAASITAFEAMNKKALTNPDGVKADIAAPSADYRVPFFMNNVHSDECPGSDSQLNLLWTLATEDTISYNTLTGLKSGKEVDMKQFDPKLPEIKATGASGTEYKFSGLGSQKYTVVDGKTLDNDGKHDASELYNISEAQTYKVSDLLKNLIIISSPAENPDGITYNSRRNDNGFDLNRDASNQTQLETIELYQEVAKWNPIVFAEMHGYMSEFLVEPCTPPHEPNLEYDLLVEKFLLGAEAFGKAALGTMSKENAGNPTAEKFWSYYTPLRDDFDPKTTTWSAWDDLCTNYGPSYAMLNSNSMGFTIETPSNNETSTRLLEAGLYGLLEFTMDNRQAIYNNQLEFFKRGLTNLDVTNTKDTTVTDNMSRWYVDINNNELEKGTWRKPGTNDNYFPEYWMLPVSATTQRDPADAYAMGEFLIRNGVLVSKLTADVTVGGITYKAGDLAVDMHQAKRNYANAVLWGGADASNSGFPDLYSESVSNFPEMRGFTCTRLDVKDALAGKLAPVASIATGASQMIGTADKAIVLHNNGQEAVRAVNELLTKEKTVGLITQGDHAGSFLMDKATYETVSGKYMLVATAVEESPVAYAIKQPTVFLAGRYDNFNGAKIPTGYYSKWFADGYGYKNYANNQNNGDSGADVVAYTDQLHFNITTDPTKASVVIGSTALDRGEKGAAAVKAVQAGTPYIATGSGPLKYIRDTLLPGNKFDTGEKDAKGNAIYGYKDFDYTSLGMESLHYVNYPTDSITTAAYANAGDYIAYSVNCAALTKVPSGADVLIQAATNNSHIAGCCLTEDGKALDGRVEAIAYETAGMDLTILGNSIINRTHQQDDYRYATTTIYSKSLAEERMSIAGVADEPEYTPGTGGGATGGGNTTTTPPVKNDDGSSTVTTTNKTTGDVTKTSTYANGVKAETVTAKSGAVTASVTIPSGKKTTVTLPMEKPAAGMVMKIVKADGTQELVKWAAPVAGGMKITLDASAKLVLVDNSKTFADVTGWATDAVAFAASRELFEGTGAGAFSPSNPMNRAMLATVLFRLEGAKAGATSTFTDVESGKWYTDGIGWAADAKIVTGTGDGFNPTGSVSRQDMVVMLYRYAQLRGMDTTASGTAAKEFSDAASLAAYASDAMTWAIAHGIITGKTDGRLDPTGSGSRAEVATILMRFIAL